MREIYAQKLSKMIQCETISSNDNTDSSKFYEFHKVLSELFPNIHKNMEKQDFDGSLLFKLKGSGEEPPLLLMSHMDVVEATGKWTHPPFSGHIDDKKVWGRGTLDTKGSLFCIMQSVEELLEQDFLPAFDLYIASSCTEETGGEGARETVKYLKANGVKIGLLIDEGGAIMYEPVDGVHATFALLGVMEKGSGDVLFTARGDGGHASAPPKNSPIARLAAFVNDIEKSNPFKVEFNDVVRTMFEKMSPYMSAERRMLFKNLNMTGPLLKKVLPSISPMAGAMLQTTMAFTMQSGSIGSNVLPLSATVTANMRFMPHQDRDESIAIVTKLAKKYDIETHVIDAGYCSKITPIDGEEYKYVTSIVNSVFPKVVVTPYLMTGATDARFYGEVTDNAIRFVPIKMDKQQFASIHTIDENISIDELPRAVEFYRQIIVNYRK